MPVEHNWRQCLSLHCSSDFQVFHLHSLMFCSIYKEKVICRSIALTSGDLLLFQWILQQFDQDLKCRLEVFAGRPGKNLMTKRQALLQNSQLWRAFSVSNSSSRSQFLCFLNTIGDPYLAEETVRSWEVGHNFCKVQCPVQHVQI